MAWKPAADSASAGNPDARTAPSGLQLAGLAKSFGDFVAVADIDLHVERGEFLTLLGPSGSGKTTLLMMIAGFLDPTCGTISLDGRTINDLAPEKRNFGMVFQGYALFPHMTVAGNIAYPLEVRKRKTADIRARVDEMLKLVQLEAFAGRLPRQLSGGQQQRVALARALSFDPEILLLDEPLGALDKKLRGEVQSELKDLHRKVGTTFIYVTHDQEEALSMSDRVVILNRGHTVQIGTPEDLYERPTTSFAADFLGKSNFLKGTVLSRTGSDLVIELGGHRVHQHARESGLAAGDKITIALRPEKLELAAAGRDGKARNSVSGRITDVTYFGSFVEVRVGTAEVGELLAELPAWQSGLALEAGEQVAVIWSPEASVIVDDVDSTEQNAATV